MTGAYVLHTTHAFSWTAWHLEPSVIGGVLVVFGLYGYALSIETGRISWLRVASFTAGSLAMMVALISPLDVGADRLLSLHMLQHVILTTVGPPLLLLGLPATALNRLMTLPLFARPTALVTAPFVAALLFTVNMWLWHVPPAYEAALNHLPVHIAMHVAFMGTGLIFWWPVIQPLASAPRIGDGARLLYLFVTGFPMGILALLLLASNTVVYPYYEAAQRVWGLSAITDQQIAGLIMGAFGETASFIAITLIFFQFIDKDESTTELALSRDAVDAADAV